MAGASTELSYSDEIILRAIRDGRRDPEIAVSLGVTVGDVKRRIERLVRTAGVSSREGLATWDPDTSPELELELPPPAEASEERRQIPWLRLGALAAVAFVAAAGAILWLQRDEGPQAVVVPAAAPTVSAALVAAGGIPIERLRFVPAAEYPGDLLLYVLRGCEGCEAPVALDRVYRDQFGILQTEVVFRPDSSAGRHILTVWAQRDASDLVIAVCDSGSCGARGPVTSDATTRFFRSTDGGASFVDIGAVPGVAHTVSASFGGPLVVVQAERDEGVSYTVLGGDGYIDPGPFLPQSPPVEFTLIAKLDHDTLQGLSRITTSAGGVFAYTSYPYSPSPDEDGIVTRLGIADRFGNTAKLLEYVGAPLTLGAWLSAETVTATVAMPPGVVLGGDIATVRRHYTPVLIDVVRGTVEALPEPFLNVRYASATNSIVAAVPSAMQRVGEVAGECLALYVFPRRDAPQSSCAIPGTLVVFMETRMVVSEEWQAVRLPSGRTGWVRPEDVIAFAQ